MTNNQISYYVFTLLICITAFQFSAWGITGDLYFSLRSIIMAAISSLFFVSFKDPANYLSRISSFRTHTLGLIILSISFWGLYAIGYNPEFGAARDLAIALVILLIGLNMKVSEKQFIRLINIYIALYTLAAISLVFTYASGFVIQEQYLPIPKNQVAPAFGIALILSLFFGFKNKSHTKWIYFIFSSLLLASMLVIRGRAVIVSIFITVFIFIYYYIRQRKYKLLIIGLAVLLITIFGKYIYDALFLNYDINDLESVSAGRFETYLDGIEFFLRYPLGGKLENPIFPGGIVHNYILINLVNHGILLATVILIIYFKYIQTIIHSILHNRFQYYEVGPLIMIIPMVVSLFEYTYPYSPGSAVFFPFFLFGQYLRVMNNKIDLGKIVEMLKIKSENT